MTQRKSPGPKRGTADGVSTAAFDTWLDRGLHELYDDVTKEPIPDALLRLIRDDEAK